MKSRHLILAAIAVSAVSVGAQPAAETPAARPRVLEILNADRLEHADGRTLLTGNVQVRTEEWELGCASLTYEEDTGAVTAVGPLIFTRETLVLRAGRLAGDLTNDRVSFFDEVQVTATPKPRPAPADAPAPPAPPEPLQLFADRLDYDGGAQRATAAGRLRFTYRKMTGTAGEMVYDLERERVEFRGEPEPTLTREDGARQVARRVAVELSEGRMTAEQVRGQLPIAERHDPPQD